MKVLDTKEFNENVFQIIGSEWMLITSGTPENFNTMTASWGGLGVMWGKQVACIVVRPERYTYNFIEQNDYVTLSFLGSDHADIYKVCGSKSGRDTDKIKATGLLPIAIDQKAVTFEQSRLTLVCRKLYADDIKADKFIDQSLVERWYKDQPGGSFHRAYVLEIEQVLVSK